MMTIEAIESLIEQKKEQLNLAVERHEFLEQYELQQEIKELIKQRETVDQAMVG